MALSEQGELLASSNHLFNFVDLRQEQPTQVWWQHVLDGLRIVVRQLRNLDASDHVAALSVTSTSGTVIPLDYEYRPIGPALMYSDERQTLQASLCRTAANQATEGSYKNFNTSSGLPKICWFSEKYPDKSGNIKLWVHAVDYLVGQLSGVWGVSDYTSVLKTGYDLDAFQWPGYIQDTLHLPVHWFPEVVPSGSPVGRLHKNVAAETGLSTSVIIAAGMTDGCASQIAAGAVMPGDWNTTIGTTLVVKGVSRDKIIDPRGSLYNHRHPQGYWMPGGASNTGANWVSLLYSENEVERLNEAAGSLAPTTVLNWPLTQKGERFPFTSPNARGFYPDGVSREVGYTSGLEGVAYIERMAYERIEKLTGQSLSLVYTAGGASRSHPWLKIRSSVLRVPIVKMRHTEGAAGAAMTAAGTYFGTLQEAARCMLQPQVQVEPDPGMSDSYEQTYANFVSELTRRGYLG